MGGPCQRMNEKSGKKSKQKAKKDPKDPNAPRRAKSAFFWFSKDERSKIDLGVRLKRDRGCVAMELGRRWNETDKNAKKMYEEMALKDEVLSYKTKLSLRQYGYIHCLCQLEFPCGH
ncbi:high mobility group protein DSP1-like isoform X4 [Artemia franciscana]|uniref:high mobility group protein DSP1-like isoform X4 n=1 Tax=Artemia franciscana TaxID=6661 RepID=UPI0032DACCFC